MSMGSRWFSVLFLGVVVAVLTGLLYAGYFASSIVRPASNDSTSVTFDITKGEGVHEISQHLADQGLINSRWNFEVYLWLHRWGSRLQAGSYTLAKNMTIRDLADVLVSGKNASPEARITLVEGWTMNDIGSYLEGQGLTTQKDFLAATQTFDANALPTSLKDKPSGADLEGYLFPDTYRIYRGASAENIVGKLVQNFDDKLTPDLRQTIAARHLTVFEVVTMASILEKEVKNPSDLPLVADIFYRRLAAGKPLQSDATLIYVLNKNDAELTADDLKIASPYNTYLNKGLPPGPISNPGVNAIRAAIFPKANNYWYFLTAPDGHAVFAQTYDEHLRNKQLYLK